MDMRGSRVMGSSIKIGSHTYISSECYSSHAEDMGQDSSHRERRTHDWRMAVVLLNLWMSVWVLKIHCFCFVFNDWVAFLYSCNSKFCSYFLTSIVQFYAYLFRHKVWLDFNRTYINVNDTCLKPHIFMLNLYDT